MAYKRPRAAFESDGPPHHAPFALYGTPLPAYDPESRDDGSYVPVWKQEVTDERGRKRLHGAFTGGFSAGYFNTVGSKEGWAPSTFVSSRANRAKDGKDGKQQQRAEDFMDEEDLAEQVEAQKLETQGAFAGLGGADGGASAKGMFSDMFKASGDTMGVKLLQRMGWRQGQGIGPKVRRQAKGDLKGETHLFAPENSCMISFARKNDRKGIGFAGKDKLESVLTGQENDDEDSGEDARILRTNRSKLISKPKPLKKSGFGVGVLNDGSDDEDPYAMGPSISYNRIIGGKKKKPGILSSNTTASSVVKPTLSVRKNATSRNVPSSNATRKCHDGRLPLDGFVLAISTLAIFEDVSKYAPPTVPAGWKPSRMGSQQGSAESAYTSAADAAKASSLDPKARAALLGEQALPGKSIFDFLTPEARERLAAASGKTNLPPALGEKAPAGFEPSENDKRRTLWDFVPQLSKETAAMALQRGRTGWMPYAEDEEKRARYKYFLELSSGLQSHLPEKPKAMELEAWGKEMREFAEAAEIFRPVTGMMASRFTSSSGAPKLATDAPDPSAHDGPGRKEEDAAEKAARMGMYGPLTRSKVPFFPSRLLCKRFNVRPPATVSGENETRGGQAGAGVLVDEGKRLDIVSQASLDRMMIDANVQARERMPTHGEDGHASESVRAVQQPATVDVEKNEALEGQRAGDDVFKAIFGSDDEEDE